MRVTTVTIPHDTQRPNPLDDGAFRPLSPRLQRGALDGSLWQHGR